MNLLAAKLYDPAAAVTKNTTAALAMTALDTTNLRLAITVPAHGMVRFKLSGCVHGATTFPSILLGVLNGSTVVGRVAPKQTLGNTAVATALVHVDAEFTATGLTPGAMNVDAAYGVETLVAATGIKYGGPNNTTANDAFGGFLFEAWDPQPLKAALDGGVNVTQFGGAAGTFAGGRPEVNVSHFGGSAGTFSGGRAEVNTSHWGGTAVATAVVLNAANIGADAITAAKIADNAIDAAAIASGAITSAKFASGAIDATAFAQGAADKVWSTTTRALTDKAGFNVSSIDANVITAAVLAADAGTELGTAVWASATRTLTANPGLDAGGVRSAVGLVSANLDTQLAAIAGFIDTEVGTLQTTADAIKAKTDGLTFTVAGKVDVHVQYVNGVQVIGTGASGDRWRALGT